MFRDYEENCGRAKDRPNVLRSLAIDASNCGIR
jgi:hypothetical protein